MENSQELYNILSYYTLSLGDPEFIHQHIVDAYAAQNANDKTKSITITFALVGLYLYIEKGYSGKEVQNAHIKMAKQRKNWPSFDLPKERGEITVSNVLHSPEGKDRKEMIYAWSQSVWNAYHESHKKVKNLVNSYPI